MNLADYKLISKAIDYYVRKQECEGVDYLEIDTSPQAAMAAYSDLLAYHQQKIEPSDPAWADIASALSRDDRIIRELDNNAQILKN